MKPKYLITNLVYGDTYLKLFVNNHLKSLLDPSNLPAITEQYDVEYLIFTDKATSVKLQYHPNLVALSKIVKVSFFLFQWPDSSVNKFNHRYGLLLDLFKESVERALKANTILTAWVADLVVAQEFFPRIMKRMEEGHDAVFVLPLRSASEPMTFPLMQVDGAMTDLELCQLGFECLHPLWGACHWDNPQFTKLPFTLLWNTGGGLLARSFSVTPIVFRPTEEMLKTRGMIDGDIPGHFTNPYWCEDWTDAPVIGVEPLVCYYPTFANRPSDADWVRAWSQDLDPTQLPFLEKKLFYPNRERVGAPQEMLERSDAVVAQVLGSEA